jgi:hypothetical protein
VKSMVVGLILSSALALPALAALKQGTSAPDFSAQTSVAGVLAGRGAEEGTGRRLFLPVGVHRRLQYRSSYICDQPG